VSMMWVWWKVHSSFKFAVLLETRYGFEPYPTGTVFTTHLTISGPFHRSFHVYPFS